MIILPLKRNWLILNGLAETSKKNIVKESRGATIGNATTMSKLLYTDSANQTNHIVNIAHV